MMNKTQVVHSRNSQSSESGSISLLASGSWEKLWENDWQEKGAFGITWRGSQPCSPSCKHRLFSCSGSPGLLSPLLLALPLFPPGVQSGCSLSVSTVAAEFQDESSPPTEQHPLQERNKDLKIKLKFGLVYSFILRG